MRDEEMRAPNTRMQRTRSSPSALRSPLMRSPLGGPASVRTVVLAVGVILLLGAPATASLPMPPDPLSREEVIVLCDMAEGNVRQQTIDAATQGLLSHDFGNFGAAALLGSAVVDRLLTENTIRQTLEFYGCNQHAMHWHACRHTVEAFESSLQAGLPRPAELPQLQGDGSDLFVGVSCQRFAAAVYRSMGDPAVIELVRAIPAHTVREMLHPRADLVVINPPGDSRLFCTIEAWRSTPQAPNRWLAVLMQKECRAKW